MGKRFGRYQPPTLQFDARSLRWRAAECPAQMRCLGVLTALDQPWLEARAERGVDTERNSVFLVNLLKEIVHLSNLHDDGVVH